jgi:phage-related protein
VALAVDFYTTEAGRQPARESLDSLPAADRAYILTDLAAYARDTRRAPVSWKPIKGHRPMNELRTGRFRTFFVVSEGTLWVLGVCKKDNQEREIAAAGARMKRLLKE